MLPITLPIGPVFGSIDGLHIAGSPDWQWLQKKPIIRQLQLACHTYKGVALRLAPGYGSKLRMTLPPSFDLDLLQKLPVEAPGTFSVTQVELAYDIFVESESHAMRTMRWLVQHLRKRNHQRDHIDWYFLPDKKPPKGLLRLPTFYYEDATSSVRLKIYARHEKRHQKSFSEQLIVRLEWTLRKKSAIVRHLQGNEIGQLIKTDFNAFLHRHLRLETTNFVNLGTLLYPNKREKFYYPAWRGNPARSTATIGAQRIIKCLAARDPRLAMKPGTQDNWDLALTANSSPASIITYLKSRRCHEGGKRFTDYKIETCFETLWP